jgi:hypothetical protein
VFCTRTDATYPWSQLAPTLTDAEKTSAGGAGVVGFGFVVVAVVFSGTGVRLVTVGRAEVRDGVADGEADDDWGADGEDEDEEADGDGEIGTCGIDGNATRGCRAASAGPTARTATQTTSRTRTAAAALRKTRAGPSGRAECFAGKRATPSMI